MATVDINLPIAGLAIIAVFAFVNTPTPSGTLREKFIRVDWMYEFLFR